MDADLKSLEDKVSQLIDLCGNLREENAALRGNLMQVKQDADALKDKMLLASDRLESLLETMPAMAQQLAES
jgi:cell division protein ZapB